MPRCGPPGSPAPRRNARAVDQHPLVEPDRRAPVPGVNLARVGPTHEWHLVFPNAVQHLAFGLVPWFHESIVRFGTALLAARFKTVGPVGDSVVSYGVEQVLIEGIEASDVLLPLKSNHGLES